MAVAAVKFRNVGMTFDQVIAGTQQDIHDWVVRTAKREHSRVMNTPPRPVYWRRYVDGVEGAPEEAVKNVVHYFYPRLDVVTQYAMEVLFELSPVLENVYRRSHILMLNGTPVASVKEWAPGDEIIIGNMVPYARKIEVGAMTMRVPGTDHVYQQAAKKVRARYGQFAKITFTFRGVIAGRAVNPHYAKGSAHNTPSLRYPVLLISEL